MNERERIRELRGKSMLTFSEGAELDRLLNEQEERRIAKEAKEREMIEEGKQVFTLRYRRGTIFQSPEDMTEITREVWAKNAKEAAEISCRVMIGEESLPEDPTGVHITDAVTCRLDTFKGDQRQPHDSVWVNPYGIAPSQQSDGGPLGFAEDVVRNLTGRNAEVTGGKIDFID